MKIELTEEEVQLLLECIHGHRKAISEWNFGDEWDIDTKPFTDLELNVSRQAVQFLVNNGFPTKVETRN